MHRPEDKAVRGPRETDRSGERKAAQERTAASPEHRAEPGPRDSSKDAPKREE